MKEINTYIINLDLAPEKRWEEVVTDYKQECLEVFKKIDAMMDTSVITSYGKSLALAIIGTYRYLGGALYVEELEGIAKILGVSPNQLILGQLMYEMFSACTSTTTKFNDSNIHFRSMDWGMDYLKKVTVNLIFMKKGKELYRATSWAGYVGIMTGMTTGMERGNYSVSLNYRRSDGTLLGNVKRAMEMRWPVGYLIRDVLESRMHFKDAYRTFKDSYLISPCYITMCSSNDETCIIVRNPDSCSKFVRSDSYACQTNIDPGCRDQSQDIMFSVERRDRCKTIVNNETNNWKSYDDVIKSFSVFPIVNDITIYCVLMDPKNKIYKSFIP